MQRRTLILATAALGSLALAGTAFAALNLVLTAGPAQALGLPAGFLNASGVAVNSAGTVVGNGTVPVPGDNPVARPLRSVNGGLPVQLPILAEGALPSGRNAGFASDVSESGVAVGWVWKYFASFGSVYTQAALWDVGGNLVLLPMPSLQIGVQLGSAAAISPSGVHVVGNVYGAGSDARPRPVRWTGGGSWTVLPFPPGTWSGVTAALSVRAVNDAGVAVGSGALPLFNTRTGQIIGALRQVGVRWSAGGAAQRLEDYVPPGTSAPTYGGALATDVLADGSAIGTQTVNGVTYALRWDPSGAVSPLPAPGSVSGANEAGMFLVSNGVHYAGATTALASESGLSLSPSGSDAAWVTGTLGGQMARWKLTLAPPNAAPTATFALATVATLEGSATTVTATVTDADGPAPLTYAWDVTADGVDDFTVVTPTPSYTFTPTDDGATVLRFRATDGAGAVSGVATVTVEASNVAPTATFAASPASVPEGSPFRIALTNPFDASPADRAAGFLFALDCGSGNATFGAASTLSCATVDDGTWAVRGTVRDKDGATTEYAATVAVTNVAPTVSALLLPAGPVAVGTPVSATASFADPGTADTHTAQFTWDWDLAANAAVAGATVTSGAGANGSAASGTMYTQPGVYTVRVAVTDDDGGVGTRVSTLDLSAYVVVYDPSAGFVTGGGWIASGEGDCTLTSACAAASGKASFGFVARYQKGATAPSGNTEFEFHAGGFRFKSASYEWLVVAGARAQYKGEGAVNGGGSYGFILTAVDGAVNGGGTDRFRIKVWDRATGAVVYDNQRGQVDDSNAATALGGGSIVIHSK